MKPVERFAIVLVFAGAVAASASQIQLPAEPPRGFGAGITASFEGWFDRPDGSRSFLIGYLNRNRKQAIDIPIGPNNRIEPGGPDLGQPTHFLPGRHTGMFAIPIPKGFAPPQQLTWTLTVNGQTTTIPFRLHTDYNISPLKIQHDLSFVNTPPVLRFDQSGPALSGPLATATKPSATLTAKAGAPLTLAFWTEDDAKYSSGTNAPIKNPPPPVEVTWSKYRGPGAVTFDAGQPKLQTLAGGGVGEPFRGRGATTATFAEPGEYMLHVTVNDYSGEGGGGEMCCWTSTIVRVTVVR